MGWGREEGTRGNWDWYVKLLKKILLKRRKYKQVAFVRFFCYRY